MPSTLLDESDFRASVVAVPPIALTEDLRVAEEPNRRLARHIEAGGVRIVLYGGNANLYHFGIERYAEALDILPSVWQPQTRLIFSVGPDFGKAMDQVPLVRRYGVQDIMLLPMAFPTDPQGVAEGVRRIADQLGHGLIFYIKQENYIRPDALARLVDQGAVRFVKYAVEKDDPAEDAYLDSLLSEIGAARIASGMGEAPIANHIGRRGLVTFTSGAVCIAPDDCMKLLRLYQGGQHAEADRLARPFLEFERLRKRLGGLQVLHAAVSAEIAEMGPPMPMISRVEPQFMEEVRRTAAALRS